MYGNALSQLLPYQLFEFVEYLSLFTFDFFINYNKESDIGYILPANVDYLVYLQLLHRDIPFLPEKRVINEVIKLMRFFIDKKICMLNCISKASFETWLNSKKSTCSHKT